MDCLVRHMMKELMLSLCIYLFCALFLFFFFDFVFTAYGVDDDDYRYMYNQYQIMMVQVQVMDNVQQQQHHHGWIPRQYREQAYSTTIELGGLMVEGNNNKQNNIVEEGAGANTNVMVCLFRIQFQTDNKYVICYRIYKKKKMYMIITIKII